MSRDSKSVSATIFLKLPQMVVILMENYSEFFTLSTSRLYQFSLQELIVSVLDCISYVITCAIRRNLLGLKFLCYYICCTVPSTLLRWERYRPETPVIVSRTISLSHTSTFFSLYILRERICAVIQLVPLESCAHKNDESYCEYLISGILFF